ncbi:hypothetical protein EIN_018770 [Entamoeba invadens IP1]|uniref:hypothetical protein n=1 Tax=Entamoeba invadens IP1 TaxID=370355 RepID=UPI0002C3EDBA|nr:hypothetical protein EIN_018770 [Entamoeba invadens IP1]ELP90518.1 hypothetical protein EIN_018770 [Entamoeba invadens IP1]|eukprot:XP_004257289.1 hypothetical protein EIN_018770 [Entamoeba invadens IP1]
MEETINSLILKQYVFERYLDNRQSADLYVLDEVKKVSAVQVTLNETVESSSKTIEQLQKETQRLTTENNALKQMVGTLESQIAAKTKAEVESSDAIKHLTDRLVALEQLVHSLSTTSTFGAKEVTHEIVKEKAKPFEHHEEPHVELIEPQKPTAVVQEPEKVVVKPSEKTTTATVISELKKEEEPKGVEEILDTPFDKTVIDAIEKMAEKKVVDTFYKGTDEGFSAEEFNRCVGSNKKVLVIVKTTKNDIFGGYCSEFPIVDDVAKGVFGDKEHFVFRVKDGKATKYMKRDNSSYSTWAFPDDSENILSFAGAFVISGNCKANEESRISGNFSRDYVDNGEKLCSTPTFAVDEMVALQMN